MRDDLLIKKASAINTELTSAIIDGDPVELKKQADRTSDFLMNYSYTQGQLRRILGGFNGDTLEIKAPQERGVFWDHEIERPRIQLPIQPEYKQISLEAAPLQSWGGPYAKRVSAEYIEGYFSNITSDRPVKHIGEVKSYDFDFIEFIKNGTVKQILQKEDTYFYTGINKLLSDAEEIRPQISIGTADFDSFDHADVIDIMTKHISPAKRNQPKEFMIMPEVAYVQFGKLPQTSINNLSKEFFDNGFGSKDNTDLYDLKTLRFDDASYATFIAGASYEESKFGNKVVTGGTTTTAHVLAMAKMAGYKNSSCASAATFLTDYGIDVDQSHAASKSGFIRIFILPPLPFLGKAMLWEADMKTNIRYANDKVEVSTSEWFSLLLHNKFAPTALDLWFKA